MRTQKSDSILVSFRPAISQAPIWKRKYQSCYSGRTQKSPPTLCILQGWHHRSSAGKIQQSSEKFIPRIPHLLREDLFPFQLQRRQFPVRGAFAMTPNRSQGQILKCVGLYSEKDLFTHGQLYAAMSRTRDPKELAVNWKGNEEVCTQCFIKKLNLIQS